MKTVVGIISAVLFTTMLADARVWTDTSGRKVEANLKSYSGNIVSLEKNGRTIQVPFSRLSSSDQHYLLSSSGQNTTATASPTDPQSIMKKMLADRQAKESAKAKALAAKKASFARAKAARAARCKSASG